MSGDERSDLLRWYVEMGVDEAIAPDPHDRFAPISKPLPKPLAAPPPAPAAVAQPSAETGSGGASSARAAAASAMTLDALRLAVTSFEGCALKRTATNTVFAEGVAGAPLLVIGEAPGADEDRQGLPFVGRSGQLLDRMLAAIGRDRKRNAYITNMLFWRPPGNRKPTEDEVATCLPFVWRLIALLAPRVILLSGGTSAASILGRPDGITRLRGRWYPLSVPDLDQPVPTLATYHPAFLLRSPARKAEAWRDLLDVQAKLESSE